MKTEFENLQNNDAHSYEVGANSDKHVVKIYCGDILIAKKINLKKTIRYFGVKDYKRFLASV